MTNNNNDMGKPEILIVWECPECKKIEIQTQYSEFNFICEECGVLMDAIFQRK